MTFYYNKIYSILSTNRFIYRELGCVTDVTLGCHTCHLEGVTDVTSTPGYRFLQYTIQYTLQFLLIKETKEERARLKARPLYRKYKYFYRDFIRSKKSINGRGSCREDLKETLMEELS